MSQKGLSPIAIVLLIALAIGGYLVYSQREELVHSGKVNLNQTTTQVSQPTPVSEETANWKTYTNIEKEVSISYPMSWNVVDEPNIIFSKKDSNLSCVIFIDNFQAVIGSNGEPYFGYAPYKSLEKSNTKLGNFPATKYVLHEGEGGSYILIVNNQPINDLAYRLQCSSDTNDLSDADYIIGKMAPTFKFTQ